MENLREYINKLRHDFTKESLSENTIDKNPFTQFEKWFKEAIDAQVPEPNATTLCTSNSEHIPSARIVLLRDFNETDGFIFYSNYNSRKGKDLEENPNACINFFWPQLERQIRISGTITKHSPKAADIYFKSRPLESRIGAWASAQSEKISNREVLEDNFKKIEEKFGSDIPRPEWWGGYSFKPSEFEFWQGRPNRLHDRILFSMVGNEWKTYRLSP